MFFQRAARTDKSVSAIRQIVSIKISESIKTKMSEINSLLPEDIRLMGCKRVTQSFDAKNYCDARTYSYLMPTYALCPLSEVTKEDYRVNDEVLKTFNSVLEGYVGTHSFHNFTSGKTFSEDSSSRVIRFMNCSKPFFPCNQKDIEFVVVRVKGQSFMMHQIRKMIGLAIAVAKGYANEEHIKKSMEEPFMDVPKAPGLGLMLEEVHFDRYNRKFGGDGHHEPIEWEAENEAISAFKDKYIYPVVVETERKDKSMFNWLSTLSLHTYGEPKPEDVFGQLLDVRRSSKKSERPEDDATPQDEFTTNSNKKKIKLDETDNKDENIISDSKTTVPLDNSQKGE